MMESLTLDAIGESNLAPSVNYMTPMDSAGNYWQPYQTAKSQEMHQLLLDILSGGELEDSELILRIVRMMNYIDSAVTVTYTPQPYLVNNPTEWSSTTACCGVMNA